MKCRRCKAPAVVEIRRHNAAFCAECFLRTCASRSSARSRRTTCSGPRTGSWSRSPAARTRSRSGTSCSSSATWPTGCTWASGSGSTPSGRTRSPDFAANAPPPGRGRPCARLRVRRADRRQEGLAVDLRGLRAVQALRLQPGRSRGRVRRDRDRAQPRRRGRHAARQHPAVEDGLHRAPVARAARGGRIRAQGQAAVPALGARDRAFAFLRGSTTWWRSARSSAATRSSATRRR